MKKTTKIVVWVILLAIVALVIYVLFFSKAQAPQNINVGQPVPQHLVPEVDHQYDMEEEEEHE